MDFRNGQLSRREDVLETILELDTQALEDLVFPKISYLSEMSLSESRTKVIYIHEQAVQNKKAVDVFLSKDDKGSPIAQFQPRNDLPTDSIEDIRDIIRLIYHRNWTGKMLSDLLQPLRIDQDETVFYSELAKVLCKATQSRYVVIRQFEDGGNSKLRCLSIYDRENLLSIDAAEYNIDKNSIFSDLYLIDTETKPPVPLRALYRGDSPHLFDGMPDPAFRSVEFVIVAPLTIGLKLTGFINIGYETSHLLDRMMSLTISTIVNHASAALENFQRTRELEAVRNTATAQFFEAFHTELLQGFRHTAQNAMAEAGNAISVIDEQIEKHGLQKYVSVEKLESKLHEVQTALTNMQSIKSFSTAKTKEDIVQIAKSAVAIMSEQAQSKGVDIRTNFPSRVEAIVNGPAIRDALANMILNSIQAFEQVRTPNANRRITIGISTEMNNVVIRIADEGPGVLLRGGISSTADIWLPGKSSKGGSGYGLPMVREVFQRLHDGSVNLRPSTRGAVFEIRFNTGLTT